MKSAISALESGATAKTASNWLRQIVYAIGPCFHFDTLPEDYIQCDGKRLLSKAECKRLAQALDRASEIIGREVFEDICLQAVWEQLGLRYDPKSDQLVSIES